MTHYLTVTEILAIHQVMMERYGGAHGIRDAGAIEAACYRPQTGYYNDIIAEAAALMESLAINHPFIDGNKRVAFAACDVFLRINGYRIMSEPMALYQQMMDLFESQTFEFKYIERMLRAVCKPLRNNG